MSSASSKKVTVERFEREAVHGFANPISFGTSDELELLSVAGAVQLLRWPDIRAVRFVREFQSAKTVERQAFLTRPKSSGLWVRMQFRDGEFLEGVMPNNLLLTEPAGFTVTPPDTSGNTQKVYVPKSALTGMQVLGVVGSPLVKAKKKDAGSKSQIGLFDGS
ncbi:MAG: hypothetical protein ABI693_15150 [Bryobacteraceae bacterium]